ncbi:hypothetical protein [Salinibacterium sp. TMP30]|uniref:hypothetical protein n=1 Tax=Salinibacterium sp. TMP30 TaxID=3138237 RepID=UPI0031393CDC
MASLNFERSRSLPLQTGSQIVDRVTSLVGTASSARLWLLLLNAEKLQLRQVVRVNTNAANDDEQVERGASGVVAGASLIDDVHAAVFVLERLGGERFTPTDRLWAQAITAACQSSGVELAGLVVSHSHGVRWLAMDDFVA